MQKNLLKIAGILFLLCIAVGLYGAMSNIMNGMEVSGFQMLIIFGTSALLFYNLSITYPLLFKNNDFLTKKPPKDFNWKLILIIGILVLASGVINIIFDFSRTNFSAQKAVDTLSEAAILILGGAAIIYYSLGMKAFIKNNMLGVAEEEK